MNPLLQKARQLRIAAGLPPLLKGKAHKTAPHHEPIVAQQGLPWESFGDSSRRLDTLKRGLLGWNEVGRRVWTPEHWGPKNPIRPEWAEIRKTLKSAGHGIGKPRHIKETDRENGLDWPLMGTTMVGWKRLTQWEEALLHCIDAQVPGDFVETGVWRGGVLVLAAAILEEQGITSRQIWGFDSFDGLPPPDPKNYPGDANVIDLSTFNELKVSEEEVRMNFKAWGVPTDQIRLVKGLFKHTLPKAEVQQIAALRLDGDYYESTIQALEALEPRVADNGVVIIDDYHAFAECRQAVHDYRKRNGIDFPIREIDGTGVFWYKSHEPNVPGKSERTQARREMFNNRSDWNLLIEHRAAAIRHKNQQINGPQRFDWINAAIEQRGYQRYLEIGVRNPADCYDRIRAAHKTSVDPGVEFASNPVDFPLTSDAFFAQLREGKLEGLAAEEQWDLVFIDGLHRAAQVDRDICNTLPHLRPGGMIVLHDCLPPTEEHARDTFPDGTQIVAQGSWNGSTWRAFFKHWLEGTHATFVIDADWGIGVIDTAKPREPLTRDGSWGLASLSEYHSRLEAGGAKLDFEAGLAQLR